MNIAGFQKLNINNYPGKTSCIIFSQGCNYRCPWCNSPGFILPEANLASAPINEKNILNYLKKHKTALHSCIISGGEPTLQKDLPNFCQKIKKMGYKIELDTNGSQPAMMERLLANKLVDYVAMDIKAPKAKYASLIGYPEHSIHYLLANIEKSIDLLKNSKVDYEFTTTVAPGIYKTDILEISQWLKPAKKYVLQIFQKENTFNPSYSFLAGYSGNYLAEIRQAIAPLFDECEVR